MLAVCTYSLDKCTASEIIDVVSNHQFALVKRQDNWEIIESAEHKKIAQALRESRDELQQKVRERTASLLEANEQLKEENEERLRAEQSLRLEEARLDVLLRLSRMSEASVDEIAGFTLEQGVKLTQSRIGFLGFLSEDELIYTLHAVSKNVVKGCAVAGDPVQWHIVEAGIWADAIRQRKTLFVNDYSKPHPNKKGLPPGHLPLERLMVVPVFEEGRIVAVAGVGNKASDYDNADERQIMLLLNGMWGYVQRNRSREALERAHDGLEKRVRERTAELEKANAELEAEIADRKKAEEALHESEDKYRAIFAQAADSIVLIDPENGALVDFNDRAHDSLGYTREELQKLKIPDFEAIESAEKVREHIEKIIRQGGDTFETKHRTKSGKIRDVLASSRVISIGGKDFVQSIWRDITDRKDMEAQQLFAGKILERINQKGERQDIIHDVLRLVKQFTGFEAVGIRLREEDDFPYFAVNGFSVEFVEAENYLCARDENGKHIYDSQGNSFLECMCGNVLSGRTDPALPFFTEAGSFWTNSTTTLLASTSEQERQGRTRNRCNKAGYESVALIPLRSSDQVVGLLQLNDTRWGRFTPEMIGFFEGIGASIGIALARIRAEEEAKNLAKFPSENPFPVLRITRDGTILYSNYAGLPLLSKWERQVGESAPQDWCQMICDVLDSNRNTIKEVKYGSRVVSFVLAPVAKAGYVNIYGRDVTKQKEAVHALQKAHEDLEEKVQHRTAELSDVVSALRKEARERSLAQQKLQQSEARLRDAQRIAHIGNWDWDIINNQLWWSDEVYRIFGVKPQEFEATYEAFISYVHPDDRKFVKQSVYETLYEYKPYSIDHRIVRPDGTERIVHEQAEIIHGADNSPIRMRGTVQDVTAQKETEKKILDNQEQLRSLTAELLLSGERERRKIARDLYDSIGQILAFSDRELGTLQKSSPEKLMESVKEIRHYIKQAVKQTRTLTFDLSPPSLYDLGFEAAIEELVEQFSKERKIKCSFESCDRHEPLADHVKILLYRSVRELLMNVAKHSTAKMVRIASSRVNNDLLVTVEDDGTGFDISKLKPKSGNSRGFGLFSIRERLTHVDGQLDIQSGDGKGTRITLQVPLKIKS